MRTLLLMRHAKSSWDEPALRDHDRPLNKRGRRDAPKMGALLRDAGVVPDLVLSSTATRTRETVERLLGGLGAEIESRFVSELYLASPGELVDAVRTVPDSCHVLLLVAHNPGVEDLAGALGQGAARFPTATLAHFEIETNSWSEFGAATHARRIALWRPREVL